MKFNMAGSDDAAVCQHEQGGELLFLARSPHPEILEVLHQRRECLHRTFLPCRVDEKTFLHPEYLSDIFIESARALALRTAGKESAGLGQHVPSKHELIFFALTEGTSVTV